MTFINTISHTDATGDLLEMYDASVESRGYVTNYLEAFSHRPEVLMAWNKLGAAIRGNLTLRRYELVTMAAAKALRSSYCMLAHAQVLQKEGFSADQLQQIADGEGGSADLTPAEIAMMAYAEKIIYDATAITQADVDTLRQHGFTDAEIFDVATVATLRCFFSKTLDAVGARPDEAYLTIDKDLRESLTVGRAIAGQ